MAPDPEPRTGGVVLLAGPGYSTDIVANHLRRQVPDLVVVVEEPPSRTTMARRRARRVGWVAAVGQVLFVTVGQPFLRRRAATRREAIATDAGFDTRPHRPDHTVPTVNDDRVPALLEQFRPSVTVVNGTRIIASRVLDAVDGPVINMHAGITPRYRGTHGGYWALAEGHPEWVGTTIHLVDPGIDTGGILAQATFEITERDTFATYPDLHLVAGLPLLGAMVDRALAGEALVPELTGLAPGSRLYYHPTLWGYLWCRWRRGVR